MTPAAVLGSSLYLIEILHQTTTSAYAQRANVRCILSKFYIKPQLLCFPCVAVHRCILSKFYIKPQRAVHSNSQARGCILSKFYIKPQLSFRCTWLFGVVSYRNSTSNHNFAERYILLFGLYLIEILHQTTTSSPIWIRNRRCILSKFYIKPQQKQMMRFSASCCILSKFYIKPQLVADDVHEVIRCILSKFYIKPQQRIRHKVGHSCCILSKFYIKPQQCPTSMAFPASCILSKFYIKPQL